MKFLCPISNETYEIAGVNPGLFKANHPIFSIESKQLLAIARHAQANPDKDTYYLLGLAIFNKLNPRWVAPVVKSTAIKTIIPNLERMIGLIFNIDSSNRRKFPDFVIDKTNNDFSLLPTWLDVIDDIFTELKSNARDLSLATKVIRTEAILQRYINSGFSRHKTRIANTLAEWADLTCEFPTSPFYPIVNDESSKTTTALYWKEIIRLCFKEDHIGILQTKIDIQDFQDMHDYIEFNLPHGSTHAQILMSKLRKAKAVLEEFHAPARPRIVYEDKSTPLISKIMELDTEGVANALEIAKDNSFYSNPGPMPKQKNFKSVSEFLKAKLKWQVAMTHWNRMGLGRNEEGGNNTSVVIGVDDL